MKDSGIDWIGQVPEGWEVRRGLDLNAKLKDSGVDWIGQVPEGWEVKRIRDLGLCSNGLSKGGEFFGHGFPVVSYGDVYKNLALPDTIKGLVESTEEERRICSVKRGDVLFTRTSETVEELGFASTCLADIPNATFAGFLIRVRPHKDLLEPEFAKYYFRGSFLRQYFIANTAIVTRASLSQDLLKNLVVLCPPIPEQREIAAYLDEKTAAIDGRVAILEKKLSAYRRLKTSIINHAVTRGLDPKVKLKDSGVEWIGKIPAEWCVTHLKRLTKKIGSGKTPSGGAEIYSTEGVMFLRSQNVYDEGLLLDDVAFISHEIDSEMASTRVFYGDVLLNITGGSIGRCCVYAKHEHANVNQHVCIIRADVNHAHNTYIKYFWNTLGQEYLRLSQLGGNRESLNFEQIGNAPFPCPRISEQRAIADYLDAECAKIDKVVEIIAKQIDAYKRLKRSLINEVVTGKRKVA